MTPHDLIAAFDLLAEAPDGAKRLRELVLQLAVRGKLVPQDPGDEPASVLLERIAVEKAKLAKEGKLRKIEPLPDAETPFDVPTGWAWTCTAGIGIVAPRCVASDDALVGFLPMPVIPTDFRGTVEPERRTWGDIKKGYTHVGDGDVVVAKITPCFQNRKSCVIGNLPDGIGAGTTELHVVRPFADHIDPKYLLIFYKTPDFIAGGVAKFTGTAGQQRVPSDYFTQTPLPLPPLAEQHRIVARVDNLMGLLDQLEAARNGRGHTREATRDAALAALRDANTPEDVEVAWQRVAERMDDLFTEPGDVDPLRQAVLQLAVRGKLVPQDPVDEPASELLERIAVEKAKLVKEGKLRKMEPLPDGETPFDVPTGWAWTCTAGIGIVAPRCVASDDALVGFLPMPVIPTDFRGTVEPERRTWGDIKKGYTHVGDGDVVVAKITPCFQNRKSCVIGNLPDGIGAGTTELHVVRPFADHIDPKYLLIFYKTPDFIAGGVAKFTGTAGQQRVPSDYFTQTPLPLPPLAEQHRIVARVDNLMGLLDRLEQRLKTQQDLHGSFAAAAVHHLEG